MKNRTNVPQNFLVRQPEKQNFPGFASPSDDFKAVNSGLRSPVHWIEYDLTAARSIAAGTAQLVEFAGNSFFVDGAPDVGEATVRFQMVNLSDPGAPIYVQPKFIARIPFTRFLLENAAQPGKVMRIVYGVDIDFVPGATSIVNVANQIETVDAGFSYGAAYQSNVGVAGNTAYNIIAAASNLNGYILHAADFTYNVGSVSVINCSMLANPVAPLNVADGDVLASNFYRNTNAAAGFGGGELSRPVNVAAGERLDYISSSGQTGNVHHGARYTLK